jgi:hypothetical protein
MENGGKSTAQAAIRETAKKPVPGIAIDAPFALISIPHINQVTSFYRGRLTAPDYSAGEESLEVALVQPRGNSLATIWPSAASASALSAIW